MTGLSLADVLDLLGAFLVLVGCFLCFAAALGLLRFPDVVSRMHAATKPQTLGLIVLAAGVEVSLRSWASRSRVGVGSTPSSSMRLPT